MDGINPVSNNDYSKSLTLNELKKMDETSIFNKLDTDKSGTISEEELTTAGFVKKELTRVKEYLISRFGETKINNIKQNAEYFDYGTNEREIQTPNSYEEIPLGSHSEIRDARACDISKLELTEEQLLNLCIDKTTIMSPEQKTIVEVYTEKGKNPGLGIRSLHAQGITGKGVHMAIIDQPLSRHQEYSENIRSHTDINTSEAGWSTAQLHGAAVTSIAVGKSVGVAPDATVDYYSTVNLTSNPDELKQYKLKVRDMIEEFKDYPEKHQYWDNKLKEVKQYGQAPSNIPYANAIIQILDKNKTLPPEERVSVISISWGFDILAPGFEELQGAIARAKEESVFVISTALDRDYGFDCSGANRDPKGDIESAEAYEAGAFWKEYSENVEPEFLEDQLLVPMDHRTTADFTDETSYRYEGNDGGMSWAVPWLAGMYVLAKQTNPDITPEDFWKLAQETADECTNNDTGKFVGKIINPQKLIEKIQEQNTD